MKLTLFLSVLLPACASTPSPSRCTAGQVSACPCTSGGSGVQTCGSDGAFGACVCALLDAGADTQVDAPSPADVPMDLGAEASADVAPEASVDATPPQDAPGPEVSADGALEAAVCPAGFGDCDAVASNGCETSILDDWGNCGACGRVCPNPSAATPFCRGGVCGFNCDSPLGDCDRNIANGCETRTDNNPRHCGACGNDCGSRPCVAGRCT